MIGTRLGGVGVECSEATVPLTPRRVRSASDDPDAFEYAASAILSPSSATEVPPRRTRGAAIVPTGESREREAKMSWDAVLLRVGPGVRSFLETDEELPLGRRKEVVEAILAVFPTCARESPTRLLYEAGDLSMEFALHGGSPVGSVTVEVRGEGDPVSPLLELATRNGWVVLDVSMSEFIDPAKPGKNGYGGYRRMVRGIRGGGGTKRRKR
jgi:hypothetical protein